MSQYTHTYMVCSILSELCAYLPVIGFFSTYNQIVFLSWTYSTADYRAARQSSQILTYCSGALCLFINQSLPYLLLSEYIDLHPTMTMTITKILKNALIQNTFYSVFFGRGGATESLYTDASKKTGSRH